MNSSCFKGFLHIEALQLYMEVITEDKEHDAMQWRSQGGGLRGLEHPPLRWSEYAVNGSDQ